MSKKVSVWTDNRVGRRPLIVAGLLIFALGSVVAAATDSIWGIILGRALQGSSAIAAAVMALLSDLTREQNRTKAMAFIGVSFGITFAIAMVLGPVITHAFGLSALFWGIAVLALAGIVITLTIIPQPSHHVLNRESAIVKDSFRLVLRNSRLLKLNAGIMSLHILLMASFVALPLAMESAGFLRQQQWVVYLTTMLVSFVAVIPFVIYAEKIENLKNGIIPIYEPGLEPMVMNNYKKGALKFTTQIKEALDNTNVCFIAVGTPMGEDGSADLHQSPSGGYSDND
jgi:MFS family permease